MATRSQPPTSPCSSGRWSNGTTRAATTAHSPGPPSPPATRSRDISAGRPPRIFDIDETLLSNWPYLNAGQFAISADTFAAWTNREHGIALAPLRDLFARAHAYQIPIFLISGRDESLRAATQRDLEEAGYWGWSGLFLKPPGYRDSSIVPFKSGVRKMLTERGYQIILNVGDQDSDLEGGYARNRFKLPNPFYYIP